ncbi:MAG: hypothetical protein ACTSPB_17125, partial [Candidatus Thorarchaeota archaeon]
LDLKEIEVLSTKIQIEQFLKTLIWKDITRELKAWEKGFETERARIVDDAQENNPTTASVLMHLGDINGRIKAVRYLLGLPQMLIQILEEQQDDTSG